MSRSTTSSPRGSPGSPAFVDRCSRGRSPGRTLATFKAIAEAVATAEAASTADAAAPVGTAATEPAPETAPVEATR